jgi:probable rRNA maturation factor
MKTEVEVQRASRHAGIPGDDEFGAWIEAAIPAAGAARSVTVRIVDVEESRRLNRDFRGRDAATNVLSFGADLPGEVLAAMRASGVAAPLGDLVICAPLVEAEAADQGKPLRDHWAHLTIHGVLHLLGHDHLEALEARAMERREIELLATLGIADPYAA